MQFQHYSHKMHNLYLLNGLSVTKRQAARCRLTLELSYTLSLYGLTVRQLKRNLSWVKTAWGRSASIYSSIFFLYIFTVIIKQAIAPMNKAIEFALFHQRMACNNMADSAALAHWFIQPFIVMNEWMESKACRAASRQL